MRILFGFYFAFRHCWFVYLFLGVAGFLFLGIVSLLLDIASFLAL